MKKNVLGKITFVLVFAMAIVYTVTKLYIAWYMGDSFGGWDIFLEFAGAVSDSYKYNVLSELLFLPIMWSILCVVYAIYIGKNKRANRILYVGTALVILADSIFYIIQLKKYYKMDLGVTDISFAPLFIRIGFLLAVIILCIGITKKGFDIALGSILGCSVMGALVYMIVWYKRNMSVLIEEVIEEIHGFEDMIGVMEFAEYCIIPILGFIVGALIIGYILFPTKYLKEN